ncbi:MAG: hypothetical protein E7628_02115 [Ruminococcaceae bacterium]|nr:hypothetical protein [Oscillospiraceae bacterium]
MKKKLFALLMVIIMLALSVSAFATGIYAVGMGGNVGSGVGGSVSGGIGVGNSARDGISDSQSGEPGDTVDPDNSTHGDMTTENNSLNDDMGYDTGEGEGTRRGNAGIVIMALLLAAGVAAVVIALVRRRR